MIKETDLSWLAGIWDGEGSITMFSHTETNGSKKICPTCCVINTDINIINEVQRILVGLGCNFVIHEHKPLNKKHKLQWRITTRNMYYIKLFLEAISLHLRSEKKAKAEIVLRYVKQRMDKMKRFPNKGSTPYDETDWFLLTKIRSSETTREAA